MLFSNKYTLINFFNGKKLLIFNMNNEKGKILLNNGPLCAIIKIS